MEQFEPKILESLEQNTVDTKKPDDEPKKPDEQDNPASNENHENIQQKEKDEQMEVEDPFPEPPYSEFVKIIRPILSTPKIEVPTGEAFRDMLSCLDMAMDQAYQKNYSLENATQMIMALLETNLDYGSQAMWSFNLKKLGDPTDIFAFVNFLIERRAIDCHEEKELAKASNMQFAQPLPVGGQCNPNWLAQFSQPPPNAGASRHVAGPSHVIAGPSRSSRNMQDGASMESLSDTEDSVLYCPLCKTAHKLIRCAVFKRMTLAERWDAVEQFKLCVNCFSRRHNSSKCKNGICPSCKRKHNSLIRSSINLKNNFFQPGNVSYSHMKIMDESHLAKIKQSANESKRSSIDK